jgi:hypothetical protein
MTISRNITTGMVTEEASAAAAATQPGQSPPLPSVVYDGVPVILGKFWPDIPDVRPGYARPM